MFAKNYRFPVQPEAGEYKGPDADHDVLIARDSTKLEEKLDPVRYRQLAVEPTWRQRGRECTGFSLAAAVTYLIRRAETEKAKGSDKPSPEGELADLAEEQLTPKLIKRAFDTGYATGKVEYWLEALAEKSKTVKWPDVLRAVNDMLEAEAKEDDPKKGRAATVPEALAPAVSPRMMYEMAQDYDGAAAESGSTLRGALIGWERRGAAAEELWPYDPEDEEGHIHGDLTLARIIDARTRRLQPGYQPIRPEKGGPYTDADILIMKQELVKGNVLYVGAEVHTGWFVPFEPEPKAATRNIGAIRSALDLADKDKDKSKGQHAFLVVGYNEQGFWVHNSWGPNWGDDGYAVLPYDDWKANGKGAWVPTLAQSATEAQKPPAITAKDRERAATMWRHIVALDDNGRLRSEGLPADGDAADDVPLYRMDADYLGTLFHLFKQQSEKWEKEAEEKEESFTPRLLIFADDGSKPWPQTIKELEDLRKNCMAAKIYPLFLVWDVPWHADLEDELEGVVGRYTENREQRDTFSPDPAGLAGDIGTPGHPYEINFTYWLFEYMSAQSSAVAMWRSLAARAGQATAAKTETLKEGGLTTLAAKIRFRWEDQPFDLHLAGHGAGAFTLEALAPLVSVPIASCELWGPATTMQGFENVFGRLLDNGHLQRMAVTVLESETADKIGPYPESVLSLASKVLAIPGIDSADRFYYGPLSKQEHVFQNITELMEMASKDDGVILRLHRDPEPLLGLDEFLSKSRRLQGCASTHGTGTGGALYCYPSVHREVVSGLTHAALATDKKVRQATIDRIQQGPSPLGGLTTSAPFADPLQLAEAQWRARNSADPLVRASRRSSPFR